MDANQALVEALDQLKELAAEQERQHTALKGVFLLLARKLAKEDQLDLNGLIDDLETFTQLPEHEGLQEEFADVANGLRTVRHLLEVGG